MLCGQHGQQEQIPVTDNAILKYNLKTYLTWHLNLSSKMWGNIKSYDHALKCNYVAENTLSTLKQRHKWWFNMPESTSKLTHFCAFLLCSCCVSPDAELTLLAFALARGSVAKVLQALSCISDHLEAEYKASSLNVSMASVRLRLLNRNGNASSPSLLSFIKGHLKP